MVGEKEIPYCTIFLVIGAFAANVLVLMGNLDAAASFKTIGESTGGWSNVGTSMASSFKNELDVLMNEVDLSLTHAVSDIDHINSEIDTMVKLIGDNTDKSLLQLATDATHVVVKHRTNASDLPAFPGLGHLPGKAQADMKAAQEKAMEEISAVVHKEVGRVNTLLLGFVKDLTPALLQIGKWEVSFGSKLQSDISQFGTTLDWAQKAFDTIMAKLKGPNNTLEDYMVYNTFDLFDPQANNCITPAGLQGAADQYGITAISGTKGEQIFKLYAGKDGCIDHAGYLKMVADPGLSGILTTVLRTYAQGLAAVGGTVGQARLRFEVADAVVSYLNLVSAKNHTKVGWILERLTNGSIPMAFTACVLRQLGEQDSNPNLMTGTINVGEFIIDSMLYLNPKYTLEAYHMMSKRSFWITEGFYPAHLPEIVELVGGWIKKGIEANKKKAYDPLAMANLQENAETSLLQENTRVSALHAADALFQSGHVEKLKATAVSENAQAKHDEHLALIEHRESLEESHTSKHLFKELLGGKTMSKGHLTPAEWQCLHSGVPAVPATLEFARFLALNCSLDSELFLHSCFEYSSTSSNQLDSFANSVQGFVGKTSSFLATVQTYSGQPGIDYLNDEIKSFTDGAADALVKTITPLIQRVVASVVAKTEKLGIKPDPEEILAEVKKELAEIMAGHMPAGLAMLETKPVPAPPEVESKVVFQQMHTLMGDLMSLLPSAAKTINLARGEVSEVGSVMQSIFATFAVKGPALFNDISLAYSILWTTYFVLLLPLTLGTLWYGMWASGWMGGPAAADWPEESEEEAARPKGCYDRICTCYSACCICCGKCHDSLMCFWSCMIIYQVIVLVLFIVAIVISLLNGVKLFFTDSCVQIYMLNQSDMCTNVLTSIKSFITTFEVDPLIAIEDTCNAKQLLMCQLIGQKMQTSALYTTVFSFVAAIFQYQLVIESAILHERARMRRIVQQLQKES